METVENIIKGVLGFVVFVGVIFGIFYVNSLFSYYELDVEVVKHAGNKIICYDDDTKRYWILDDVDDSGLGKIVKIRVNDNQTVDARDDIVVKVNGVKTDGKRYLH